jgi:hypothetical protein
MSCKTCVHYEKGFDGKPGTCNKLIVADIWNGFDNLENDGVGYSDERYEKEVSVLYVGEYFECKHFKQL